MVNEQKSLKSEYGKLASQRDVYLNRARECAKVTLPMLVPPEDGDTSIGNSAHTYETPYQSVGARGVNHLASKLLLVMFPPQSASSFFRLVIDEILLEQLTQSEGMRAEIEESLSRIERAISLDLEASGVRGPWFEALKYLLVAGNVLLVERDDGAYKMHKLDQFVIKRSPSGRPIKVIVRERLSRSELLPEMEQALAGSASDRDKDDVELYTGCTLVGDMWVCRQELNDGVPIGAPYREPVSKSRFLPLAPLLVTGEDYARSYVEEYLGDLYSLEGLSRSLVSGAAIAAKIVFLVEPNSTANINDLNKAETGEFVVGRKEDINALQLEKYADFSFVREQAADIERRLSFAFLLNSAVQRDAERVTAEEIRYMANELEQALGGMYTQLAQSFQKPVVEKRMARLQKQGRLPQLPEGAVKVTITTGVEGLGRSADLVKLDMIVKDVAMFAEAGLEYFNMGDFLKRRAAALGLDVKGLIRSEDEVQAARQQQQQMALQQAVAPEMAAQAGGNQ